MTETTETSWLIRDDRPLPPPPPGVRHVRLLGWGIIIADDDLREHVRRRFHWPMIVLALAVLPLLAIELFVRPATGSTLWWVCLTAMMVIWFAFLVEFIVKVAVAECRIEYCKRNWLDMIIIAMPALRPLRVAAVAKTTRVFTLRGVGMKFARSLFTVILGLEATDRILRRFGLKAADGRRDPARMTRFQLMKEVRQLRQRNDAWDSWYERHESFLDEQSRGELHLPAKPDVEDEDDPEPERRVDEAPGTAV